MQRLYDAPTFPEVSGKILPQQHLTQRTWDTVADPDSTLAALHILHIVPKGASTTTEVNLTSPGDDGWQRPPSRNIDVLPAGRP